MTQRSDILDIAPREIVEDEPQTSSDSKHVVVSIPDDPTPEQSMRIVEVSGTLVFWDRAEEDIYTSEDGEPV